MLTGKSGVKVNFLSSSRGGSKLPPHFQGLHVPRKSVNFDVGGAAEKSEGALAFERLELERTRTSVTRVPENHQSLSSDELNSDDFNVFEIKFDCSRAPSPFTGLTFKGPKGMYKEIVDAGTPTQTESILVGDYLLSIDQNDVKEMTMCGLLAFLRRQIEEKGKYCMGAEAAGNPIPFKRRFIRLKLRRMTLSVAMNRMLNPIVSKSLKTKEAKLKKEEKLKKKRKASTLQSEKEPTFGTTERKKYTKRTPTKMPIATEDAEEAEFDERPGTPPDDYEDEDLIEMQVALLGRIHAGCKLFIDGHPAEALEIDQSALLIHVKWSSGANQWMSADPERVRLQEDYIATQRRR